MPFAEASDGIRLYFEEHGAGEPLLLLAGQGQDHRQWDLVRDAYAARHRVIVYDYRGLGRSDAPSEPPYTTRGQAEDAVAVLDHLGIERAHVFGVSMGGRVAQWLGIDHGARLGALVLGCTTPGDRHGIPRTAEVQQVLERTLASDEPPEGAAVLALLSLMFSPGWVNANIEVVQAMAASGPIRSPSSSGAGTSRRVRRMTPGSCCPRSPRPHWSSMAATTRSAPAPTPGCWPGASPGPSCSWWRGVAMASSLSLGRRPPGWRSGSWAVIPLVTPTQPDPLLDAGGAA